MRHTWHRFRLLDNAVSVTKCDTDPCFLTLQSVSPNVTHMTQTHASWHCSQCHQMWHTWHRPMLLDTALSVTKCDIHDTDPCFLTLQSVSPNVTHMTQTQASWQCSQCHQMWYTWHRPRLLDNAVSIIKCDTLDTDPGFLTLLSVSLNVPHLTHTHASWHCSQCH